MSDMYNEDGDLITEDMQYDLFDQYLNDSQGEITIEGVTFEAAEILKECDPIAYQTGFNDYEDSQMKSEEWFEEDPTDMAECEECGINLKDNEIYTKDPFIMCEDCYDEFYEDED